MELYIFVTGLALCLVVFKFCIFSFLVALSSLRGVVWEIHSGRNGKLKAYPGIDLALRNDLIEEHMIFSDTQNSHQKKPRSLGQTHHLTRSIPLPLVILLTSAWWTSEGGDWKRNDESAQDSLSRKELVLNDGYCHTPEDHTKFFTSARC